MIKKDATKFAGDLVQKDAPEHSDTESPVQKTAVNQIKTQKLKFDATDEPEQVFQISDYYQISNRLKELKDTMSNLTYGGTPSGAEQTMVRRPQYRTSSGSQSSETNKYQKTQQHQTLTMQNQITLDEQGRQNTILKADLQTDAPHQNTIQQMQPQSSQQLQTNNVGFSSQNVVKTQQILTSQPGFQNPFSKPQQTQHTSYQSAMNNYIGQQNVLGGQIARYSTVVSQSGQNFQQQQQQLHQNQNNQVQNNVQQQQNMQQQRKSSNFHSKMFQVQGQKYVVLRELGSGGSARVFRVITTDGAMYAMKVVELASDEDDQLSGVNAIRQELNILEALKGHGVTLDLISYEIQPRQALIVMELGDIDLKNYLRESSIISEHRIASILEDMCESLQKLHRLGFIHGDLKPQNYIFYRARLRLIDFGISKEMQKGETMIVRETLAGTPKYMAPEVIKSKLKPEAAARIHRASDVWSIGAILYELACGRSAFHDLFSQVKGQPYAFMVRVMNGDYKIDWNIRCSPELLDLMQKCLEHDDQKRITIAEILRHPFLIK